MTVPAAARPLLDMIASGEASRYNELYGGGSFYDYAQHPNVPIPIADRPGEASTAAGRYQFLHSTWEQQARELGLTDFSPASQDEAAWNLAHTTYGQKTGRDLLTDLQAGDTSRVRAALAGQWPSLGGRGGYAAGGSRAAGGSTFGGFGSAGTKRPALPSIKMVKLGREPGPMPKEPLPPVYKPPEPEEPPLPKPARLPVLATGRAPDLAASFRAAIANLARNRQV